MKYLLVDNPGDGNTCLYTADINGGEVVLTCTGNDWATNLHDKEAARADFNGEVIKVTIGKKKLNLDCREMEFIALLLKLYEDEYEWNRTIEKYELATQQE